MTTPFAIAAGLLSAAVDSVYGEAFLYKPMTRPADVNARWSADLDRSEIEIIASLHETEARALSGPTPLRSQGVKAEMPGHSSSRPMIAFDVNALPYLPRAGDRLLRIATGALYQISEVRRSSRARVACDVNLVG